MLLSKDGDSLCYFDKIDETEARMGNFSLEKSLKINSGNANQVLVY